MLLQRRNRIVNGTSQPLAYALSNHLFYYPTPSHLNYTWSFGSLVGLVFTLQLIAGSALLMCYAPHVNWICAQLYTFTAYIISEHEGLALCGGPLILYTKMSRFARLRGEVRATLKRMFPRQSAFIQRNALAISLSLYFAALAVLWVQLALPISVSVKSGHFLGFLLNLVGSLLVPFATGWALLHLRKLPWMAWGLLLLVTFTTLLVVWRVDFSAILASWEACAKLSQDGTIPSMQVYDGKHMSVYRIPDRQLAAKLVHDWVEHILASKLHLPHEVKELARSRLLARIPELAEELVTRPGGIKTALETAYTDAVTEWLSSRSRASEGTATSGTSEPWEGWRRWLEKRLPRRYY